MRIWGHIGRRRLRDGECLDIPDSYVLYAWELRGKGVNKIAVDGGQMKGVVRGSGIKGGY